MTQNINTSLHPGCNKVLQTLEGEQRHIKKEAVFNQITFPFCFHLSIIRLVVSAGLCTCSSVYLFWSWRSSCQTCSCLMMMARFSIRPEANRNPEGQRKGFIWDSRPSCYRHANRNGSAAPGVLPPDNVPRQQFCSYSAWMGQTRHTTWLSSPSKTSSPNSCFCHKNQQECFPGCSFFTCFGALWLIKVDETLSIHMLS